MIGVLEIFKVGVGPSSSHTMGPMRAARIFLEGLDDTVGIAAVSGVVVELFGSLALTGRGHATDRAILLGLEGDAPESLDLEGVEARLAAIRRDGRLTLLGRRAIEFREADHLLWHMGEALPGHPNGVRFTALDAAGAAITRTDYYSVGGGFVVTAEEFGSPAPLDTGQPSPYPYTTAGEWFAHARASGLTLPEIVMANESAKASAAEVRAQLLQRWEVMQACAKRGMATEGILPGGLQVRRRAARLLRRQDESAGGDPLRVMDWVTIVAMSVNEENAAGGRVVTAPTNGAAGLVPGVLHYYTRHCPGADEDGVIRFLLVAGAIGALYKRNASISGAEVGCQGEVGVACSMGAGGLVAALNGTTAQVEQAAEIGMEHHLGMTCDPIGGLVQVPCIERNGLGAVKAIGAARMAMSGDGDYRVTLDQVIATMWQTGRDMQTRYKETSLAGLAVHVPEC